MRYCEIFFRFRNQGKNLCENKTGYRENNVGHYLNDVGHSLNNIRHRKNNISCAKI